MPVAPDGWDAARAVAVLDECRALFDAAAPKLTLVQRGVAEAIVKTTAGYAKNFDPLLWESPDFLHGKLAQFAH